MATYNGQVTGGGLNLRASASTTATLLIQIPNNTQIVVSDYSGNTSWYCTTYSGYSGFVMKQYVTVLSTVSTISGTVTGGGLNLRQYPDSGAPVLIQIPNNQGISVASHNNDWYTTSYGGYSGFVMKAYVSTSGGGSYPITATVDTDLHGSGGYLNLRQSPDSGSTSVAQVPDGATIYVTTLSGEWLPAKYQTYTGYVMAIYVAGSDAYGTSGGTDPVVGVNLQEGDTGQEVRNLQTRLNSLKYDAGAVDGVYGSTTTWAVKYFQMRNGLSADGILGTNTRSVLNSSSPVKGLDSSILSWSANQKPQSYLQTASLWSSYPYDATGTSTVETMGASACGPTAMAMIVSTFTKKAVLPPTLSDWALANNYRDPAGQNGTSFTFFGACATAYGLTAGSTLSDRSTANMNSVRTWCNEGGLAIINAFEASPYTNGGHYLVIYKIDANGYVYVNDPNAANPLGPYTISSWVNGSWFGNIKLIKP